MRQPKESCELHPKKTCETTSKLMPKLVPMQKCLQIPDEICTKHRINPRKIKKPILQTWCPDANTVLPPFLSIPDDIHNEISDLASDIGDMDDKIDDDLVMMTPQLGGLGDLADILSQQFDPNQPQNEENPLTGK